MLPLIIGVILFAAFFYYYCIQPMSYWTNRGVKQGNPKWIFGDSFGTISRTQSITELVEMVYNYAPGKRYAGMYQFTRPILVLKDPELLKQITVKDFDHFVDHMTFIPENIDPLWDKNLVSLKGQKWREMRSILSPAFTSSKMRSMFVLMSECAETFVKHFGERNQLLHEVEMKDIFTRYTNDVIGTTAFGVKVDSLAVPNNEFYHMGKAATDLTGLWKNLKFALFMMVPKLAQVLKVKFFDKEVSDFFLNLVNDTIQVREEKGIIRPDMIHLLMEARKGVEHKNDEDGAIDTGFATVKEADLGKVKGLAENFTNIDIAAQALIFFFAGFDTVSTLMCFTGYELAINEDIQKKLREEIQETRRSCKGVLTYEALIKMKYMDMVISESLRKWPNSVGTDRICTKPYTIEPVTRHEKPLYLEKGAVLWLPIYGIHRDPKYYSEPQKFDPERFNDENKGKIDPYTYFPFGLGPRNCIGSRFALLETKVLFFHILSLFEIVPIANTPIPLQITRKSFTMNAEGGFWMGFKRLSQVEVK